MDNIKARTTLKGIALLAAIDSHLIKMKLNGSANIYPFERFWSLFEPVLEDILEEAANGTKVADELRDEGTDDKEEYIAT